MAFQANKNMLSLTCLYALFSFSFALTHDFAGVSGPEDQAEGAPFDILDYLWNDFEANDGDLEIRADNAVDQEQCEKQLERARTTFKNCMDKEVRDKPRSLELDEEISIDSVELRAKGDKKKGSSKVPEACKNSIAKLKAIMKRCGVKKTNKPSKGNNRK